MGFTCTQANEVQLAGAHGRPARAADHVPTAPTRAPRPHRRAANARPQPIPPLTPDAQSAMNKPVILMRIDNQQ